MSSTLHGVQAGKVDAASLTAVLEWLATEGFITGDAASGLYTPLPLGKAAQQSALPPEAAKVIWSDIVRAREQVPKPIETASNLTLINKSHTPGDRWGGFHLIIFVCRELFFRTTCTSSSSSRPLTGLASLAGRALRSCSRLSAPTGRGSLKG
jgi:hypothetical protein